MAGGFAEFVRAVRPGLATFVAAVALAAAFHALHAALGNDGGRQASRAVFALAALVPCALYVLRARHATQPGHAGWLLLAGTSTALVSSYLFGASFYIFYPADFLMWSETDFVNDILKFRIGHPLFSAEVNNESYTYTPGSQILTYFLASITGHATSLPAYRCVQILYTLLAVLVTTRGVRSLAAISRGDSEANPTPCSMAQEVALFGLLFLVATNGVTNPFVHNLHNDALAQCVSLLGYTLLIEYARSRNRRILIALVFVPAVGFLVKQNLALWGGYIGLYLLLFDRPRSLSRFAVYAAASSVLLGSVIGLCYLQWGDDFVYWVFYVLSQHKVVPVQSFQHLVASRGYLVVGLVGALATIRGPRASRLFGLWAIGALILLIAAWTGGINFMRHHLGPPSTIAAMWFAAGMLRFWPDVDANRKTAEVISRETALRFVLASLVAALLASGGLEILRTPLPTMPDDAYRYLADIEAEFEGHPPENVLLDLGSFIYLRSGTVMRDRASPIGERGSTDTGDLSGVLRRLDEHHYSRLLMRNYGSGNFWYDHHSWPKSSGIQRLLEKRYEVVRRIPAVSGQGILWTRVAPYGFSEIAVLEPKRSTTSTADEK